MPKGQVMSFDFMVASILLLMVIAVLAIQAGYELKGTQEVREKSALLEDSQRASDIFFNEGYPKNWTLQTVKNFGLESNRRISLEKLGYFNQMPYSDSIALIGLKNDYNITLLNGPTEIFSFGKSYQNATSIAKRERLGVLENGTVATIIILVFEK